MNVEIEFTILVDSAQPVLLYIKVLTLGHSANVLEAVFSLMFALYYSLCVPRYLIHVIIHISCTIHKVTRNRSSNFPLLLS